MGTVCVDENLLETDTLYRYQYVAAFLEFGADDIAAIHAAAIHLGPAVPSLVDAVYEKLFSCDATKRHFVSRQNGFDGAIPENIESLQLDHPMIVFRKQHLGRYLTRLVTGAYDATMVEYLDAVGRIHTPQAGNSRLNVPLVQMNALLGFVASAITSAIVSFDLSRDDQLRTIVAFGKLLWIQNDLISRHYTVPGRPPL